MKQRPLSGYQLLHQGTLMLSRMEHNGLKIDIPYLDKTILEVDQRIKNKEKELMGTKEWKLWQRRFREKASIGSREQLAIVLFQEMGFEATDKTDRGADRLDEKVLVEIGTDFCMGFLELEKLKKLHGTYLIGVRSRISSEGFLHPSYFLHVAKTIRSVSKNPNFQNIPVRDSLVSKLIRTAFIPRSKKNVLIESDYGGIEVKIAACYNHDPTLIKYIEDPTSDMHKDMAAQCFKLPDNEVTKQIRYGGKNMFVFPQFYGDWYKSCASSLWKYRDKYNLETASGIPLSKWMKDQGIGTLQRFEKHLESVEKDFWERRFKVYNEWKAEHWERYQETGEFEMLSGFVCRGIYNKKEVINHPIQGSAFHVLLLAAILIERELHKRKMKTLLCGQIHDCILADVPRNEVKTYNEILEEVMVHRVRKIWKWIIVHLEIETEIAERNWYEKIKLEIDKYVA